MRLNRSVYRKGNRSFSLFIDISNVYNQENIRGYEEIAIMTDGEESQLVYEEETWLPILPSFGVNWRF